MDDNFIDDENLRVLVDLKVKGNANGTIFVRNDLKDTIERIESTNKDRVVGIVYDGSYNLEILTQPLQELDKIIKEVTKND
jgi:phage-related minor tail protein